MILPISAEVESTDGPCGRSTCVIVNPTTRQVTHLVVRENKRPHAEYLVPIGRLEGSTPNSIHLCCTGAELAAMERFVERIYIRMDVPYRRYVYIPGQYLTFPYATVEWVQVRYERISPQKLAVRQGARVEAIDGRVGLVDGFAVDSVSGSITHLLLREGHLWGQKDVRIPASQIGHIGEGVLYLKLDKRSINTLPTISLGWREKLALLRQMNLVHILR